MLFSVYPSVGSSSVHQNTAHCQYYESAAQEIQLISEHKTRTSCAIDTKVRSVNMQSLIDVLV